MKKRMLRVYLLRYLLAFSVGAILLSTFSLIQKNSLGIPFSLNPKAFIVPVLFGGFSGLTLSIAYIRLQTSRERMRDFLNNVDDIVQIADKSGNFIFVNHAWYKTLGYSALEVKNLTIFDIIAPTHLEQCKIIFDKIFTEGKEVQEYNTVFLTKNGERIYLKGKTNCRFEKGESISTRSIFRNVSEQRKAREFQKIAAGIFEKTQDGVAIAGQEKTVTYINKAFTKITGYSEKESLGKNVRELLPSIGKEPISAQEMRIALTTQQYWQGELWTQRKNGETYPLQITINAIRNTENKTTNYACVFSDIGERKESELQMQHLATHDRLTDLPNREMFYSHANEAIHRAKEKEEKLAILFIDLDGFKYVNDQYGHHAGDVLLKLIAQRLRNRTRAEDIVARFGGDEFAILLTKIKSIAEAKKTSETILKILASSFNLGGFSVQITASIGISLYPENSNIDILLIEADKAMYEAKRLGKNRVYFIER